ARTENGCSTSGQVKTAAAAAYASVRAAAARPPPLRAANHFHGTDTSYVFPSTPVPFTSTDFGVTTRRLNGVPSRLLKSPSMMSRDSEFSNRPTYFVKTAERVGGTIDTVTIVPPTRSAVFTKYVGRFENSESRDIMLGDFSSRDGTPFNLRVVTPKSVEVKGTGVDGKTYDVSVPWK